MTLASIRVHAPDNVPVMLLKETGDPGRTLPVLIGVEEANAIARALQGLEPARPLTHDLLRDVLAAMEVTLEAVVITDLVGHTFHAELHLRRNGSVIRVSSRPSDAIALAVRTGTSIYAEEELLDREAYLFAEESDDEEPSEEVIEEFQRFIEHVRPEDFAS